MGNAAPNLVDCNMEFGSDIILPWLN
jgi:hypothetical protein